MSPFGKPIDYSWRILNNDWETLLTVVQPNPPKTKHQSLCDYLRDNNVEDGMRVYIDAAFGRWYHGLEKNYELSQFPKDKNRTFFLCYERLANPQTKVDSTNKILNWLYPNKDGKTWNDPGPESQNEVYNGDHSTSHDTALREELKSVVRKLDQLDFGGRIANLNDQFGCSSNA